MSHYSTFSNCKSTKVTKDKPPCLVDGTFSVEGKTRGYPAIYDYYRGMGYKEGDFFRKGMSNVSTVKLGDDRLRFETTLQHDSMKMVDDAAMAAGTRRRGSNGVRVLKPAECERMYRLALATVGMEALVVMEASLRLRLAEKTGGGAFQLRKTFKYFDKDGSGRIDIGEFTDALGSIGFAYNESQILALFGRYDEDLDGEINYNEFVRGVMEDDFQSDPFSRQVFANVPELERKMKSTIKQYEQKMEEEDAFDDTEALEMEHQEVCRLFNLVDRAQAGSIANDDLPLLLAALGLVGSEGQLASVRNQVVNEEGRVELEPFFAWWRSWKEEHGGLRGQAREVGVGVEGGIGSPVTWRGRKGGGADEDIAGLQRRSMVVTDGGRSSDERPLHALAFQV